jgi:hypothetical protein
MESFEYTAQQITQYKSFVPYGTHSNPSPTFRTFFILGMLPAVSDLAGAQNVKRCGIEMIV